MKPVEQNFEETVEQVHPSIRNVTEALTFQLGRIAALNHHVGGHIFREELDISLTQWRVIALIQALAPANTSRIRKILFMDKGQLSRTVKSLVARNYVEANPSKEDVRTLHLTLTEEGAQLYPRAIAHLRTTNEVFVENLTPDECTEFMRILRKITKYNEYMNNLEGLYNLGPQRVRIE